MNGSTPPTCEDPSGPRRGAGGGLVGRDALPVVEPLIDIDATLVIDHSDNKQAAAPTMEEILRPPPAAGVSGPPAGRQTLREALAGLLRKGSSQAQHQPTTSTVLDQALDSLPAQWRGGPPTFVDT